MSDLQSIFGMGSQIVVAELPLERSRLLGSGARRAVEPLQVGHLV